MDTECAPARLVPPGRIIQRDLKARGWRISDLSAITGLAAAYLDAIIADGAPITPEIAVHLARALGTSVEFWLSLEANYRKHLARRG